MKKRLFSLILAAAVCFSAAAPAAYAAGDGGGETLVIEDAAGLRAFASACTLDEYSLGLKVVLACDIDLENVPFSPIPAFSGVFEGGGHTVSNLVLSDSGSHHGLFRYLRAEGVVRELNVRASVTPGDGRSVVGGIVGENSGSILNCNFSGTVSGMNYVGGIAGQNLGLIFGCTVEGSINGKRFTGGIAGSSTGKITDSSSAADVNTGISEGSIEINDMDISGSSALNLMNAEDTNVVSDSGGIVGCSTGIVSSCRNTGTVGYPHYGYNVGGIAGRQSGYIYGCENSGSVFGRKDVGGIVGQMEPYLVLKDTVSIAREIQVLQGMINAAMANGGAISADMYDALHGLTDSLDSLYPDIDGPIVIDPGELPGGDVSDDPPPESFLPSGELPSAEDETPSGELPSSEDETPSGDAGPDPLTFSAAPPALSLMHPVSLRSTARLSAAEPSVPDPQPDDKAVEDSLGSGLDDFANVVGYSAQVISSDIGGIGSQLARVLLLMSNLISGATEPVIYEDVSEHEPADSVQGRVSSCINRGRVSGDTNVGGISGDMGVEYEFDMENALLSKLDGVNLISQTFLTKCISSHNTNYAAVSAKKDNAGGISGQEQVGLVEDCVNYGETVSEEGGYVGGIVGLSMTSVVNSASMCALDGVSYVGGITGKGVRMSGCVSLVTLGDASACVGAVSGWADLSENDGVSGNFFVGRDVGGIDGISYLGRAESISYAQMLELETLPDGFGRLKLSFVADGVLVGELFFDYGGSIPLSDIPAVPEKEGYYGSWEKHDYSNLCIGETVEAVYTPHQAALASDNTRGDSPLSLVLVEGDFGRDTVLHLAPFEGDAPVLEDAEVLEKWVLTVEGASGSDSYNIRYLAPQRSMKHSRIAVYRYSDDGWAECSTDTSGSYIIFPGSGSRVVFCAVEHKDPSFVALAALGGAALLLAAAAAVVLRVRRRKKVSR